MLYGAAPGLERHREPHGRTPADLTNCHQSQHWVSIGSALVLAKLTPPGHTRESTEPRNQLPGTPGSSPSRTISARRHLHRLGSRRSTQSENMQVSAPVHVPSAAPAGVAEQGSGGRRSPLPRRTGCPPSSPCAPVRSPRWSVRSSSRTIRSLDISAVQSVKSRWKSAKVSIGASPGGHAQAPERAPSRSTYPPLPPRPRRTSSRSDWRPVGRQQARPPGDNGCIRELHGSPSGAAKQTGRPRRGSWQHRRCRVAQCRRADPGPPGPFDPDRLQLAQGRHRRGGPGPSSGVVKRASACRGRGAGSARGCPDPRCVRLRSPRGSPGPPRTGRDSPPTDSWTC